MIICQDGTNPYLNNPNASLIAPQSQVKHKGTFYTKLSYELKISTAARLIKFIQVIAFVIFSCFMALAFQSMRKLWFNAIKGAQSVDVLMPQVSLESTDVWMVIASCLNVRDLLAMRTTSLHKRSISELTLIHHLNTGKITLDTIRICKVRGLIDFFGENCSRITTLNLLKFHQIKDNDIKKLSNYFTKINQFLLKKSVITNKSVIYLEKMIIPTSLDLSGCNQINDITIQLLHDQGVVIIPVPPYLYSQ